MVEKNLSKVGLKDLVPGFGYVRYSNRNPIGNKDRDDLKMTAMVLYHSISTAVISTGIIGGLVLLLKK